MIWLLLSFFLYAFNNVVWKWTARDENSLYLISRRALFTVGFTATALFLTEKGGLSFVTYPLFYRIGIGCLMGTLGLILMVTFLKSGSLTRLSYYMFLGLTINGSFTYLLNHEHFTQKLFIGSVILIAGYLIFLWDERRKIKLEPILFSQHLLLAGMTLCFSANTLIQWKALTNFKPLSIMLTQESVVLIITTGLYLILGKQKKQKPTVQSYVRFPIMAAVIMLAVFCGLMGLKYTNPFISSISGVLVPLITVTFGSLFFKEKLNWMQLVSFGVIVVGEMFLV
ncbi:MAG: DMT family transporter [Paludibacter sp.]|nr:DMT family transporter [Paludibacter sp.]